MPGWQIVALKSPSLASPLAGWRGGFGKHVIRHILGSLDLDRQTLPERED